MEKPMISLINYLALIEGSLGSLMLNDQGNSEAFKSVASKEYVFIRNSVFLHFSCPIGWFGIGFASQKKPI
jgi:hypothetical protein